MTQTPIETSEQSYQKMHKRVSLLTDDIGTPIDQGILETVVMLNLLGLHTFQSCEGHLDHGYPYPWVTIIDHERSRLFNRAWLRVCGLEEQAQAAKTVQAYNHYLLADIQLRVQIAEWEVEDAIFAQITALLDAFYTNQQEPITPARLLIKRFHPGTYRIEPGFSTAMKEFPASLKREYLACGQAEMRAFTTYLLRYWQQQL
jgi:hypothetical protein